MTTLPYLEPAALEACPWCGGQPKSWMVGDEDGGYWAVECHNHNDSEQTTFCGVHGDDKASAEAAWNRRAARSAPEAGKAVDIAGLVKRLNAMHTEWQKQCDGWVDSAKASGADIADDIDRLRDTVYGEAATALTSLSAERDDLDRCLNEEQMQTTVGGEIITDLKAKLAASEAEATSLRRKLEETELANKRLSDELDNLEQDACGSDDDFRRMTERAEAAEKALYLVTNERDNLSDNIAEITSRQEADLQALKSRAETAERKLEEHRRALEPFGRNASASSLAKVYAHLTREHAQTARTLSGASE